MSDESSKTPLGRMSRRKMLGTTALLGGVVAGVAGDALGQERPKAPAGPAVSPAAGPNLTAPVVQTTCGTLRGLREGKTLSFLGIRYAEAERFGLPKPVQPWQGTRNAQVWGPVCPAPEQSTVSSDELVFPHRYWIANEHCQYLNVWSQNLTPAAKKPVMVWMHGGGFTNGSSMESYAYDGRTLSEFGDVVVVSMNHRLNILGTLDLSAYGPQYASSRYTGTADLVVALQWVQENIEAFGGDREQRDDLRAVRRRRQSRADDAHAGCEGAVPPGRGAERRQQHLSHDRRRGEHQGAADDRRPHAQEPESHRRSDRQAEDRPVLGADYRRRGRTAICRAGSRPAHAQLGGHRRRPVRDARVLRLGRHHSAHGRRGVQRDAGDAHARRRPQERVVAEGSRRSADRRLRAPRRPTSSPNSSRRSRGRRCRTCCISPRRRALP